jgi:hypothetical protein
MDVAPKKGYLNLPRRKQSAMIQPSTSSRIDLRLIPPTTTPATGRLEPAAKFNPLFTHRGRITAATDLANELRAGTVPWSARALERPLGQGRLGAQRDGCIRRSPAAPVTSMAVND